MTICDPCKGERKRVCSVCGSPRAVYNDDKSVAEQSVVFHKNGWERCDGSKRPPVLTHVGCNGCPCQHRPKGSWNGGG